MPLYEYRCKSCGNSYEKIQKVNDAHDTICPKCGGEVERPLTAPSFQFKGSGWYITDYPKSGAQPPAAGKTGESSASSDSASSESKPAESKPSESKPAAPSSSPSSSTSSSSTPSSSSSSTPSS